MLRSTRGSLFYFLLVPSYVKARLSASLIMSGFLSKPVSLTGICRSEFREPISLLKASLFTSLAYLKVTRFVIWIEELGGGDA